MFYNEYTQTDEDVVITIDASDVLKKEMALDGNLDYEGHISSEVKVNLTIK